MSSPVVTKKTTETKPRTKKVKSAETHVSQEPTTLAEAPVSQEPTSVVATKPRAKKAKTNTAEAPVSQEPTPVVATKSRAKKAKTNTAEAPVSQDTTTDAEAPVSQDTDNDTKTKKDRPARLPEKFGKYIQFAYWFMKKFNSQGDKFHNQEFLDAISFYGTVDQQTTFVQEFLTNAKDNKKDIRKNILDHKKANMPKKERKPREKKNKLDADGNVVQPKEKKTRAKKQAKEVNNTQDDLINELVRRANNNDDNDTTTTQDNTNKQTANKNNTPQTTQENALDNDDDTDVSLFEFQGKQYYIDDQDVLYDIDTQDEIGKFNQQLKQIIIY